MQCLQSESSVCTIEWKGVVVMVDQNKIREAVKLMLEGIGEDVNREVLIDTPGRIARMYCEIYGD